MQQPHRQILRGRSLQVNAVGAGVAFDLNFRVAARRQAEVLSARPPPTQERELTWNKLGPVCSRA